MKIGIDIRTIGKKRTGDEVYFLNLVKNLAKINRSGSTAADNKYVLFTDRDPEKDSTLKIEIDKLKLDDSFRVIFINSLWKKWNLRITALILKNSAKNFLLEKLMA